MIFDDLINKFIDYLSFRFLEIVECFRFYKCEQIVGEMVVVYIVELWCLVIYCDKMLKDRFVCGFK